MKTEWWPAIRDREASHRAQMEGIATENPQPTLTSWRRYEVDTMRIPVRRIDCELPLPLYSRSGDAGLDLFSHVSLRPGECAEVRTGLAVAIPVGYAGFVQARSGRAAREGLGVLNAPGLVDSGYRGEIKIIAVNLDPTIPVEIKRDDRIAQMVILRVERAELEVVDALPESDRGEGGHGSTGR
jgi:dUTP pyrophosphatase